MVKKKLACKQSIPSKPQHRIVQSDNTFLAVGNIFSEQLYVHYSTKSQDIEAKDGFCPIFDGCGQPWCPYYIHVMAFAYAARIVRNECV